MNFADSDSTQVDLGSTSAFRPFKVNYNWAHVDPFVTVDVADNDNDTLREVPHPSNEGLALQARV